MPFVVKRYNDLAGPYLHYKNAKYGPVRVWFSKSAWKYFIDTPEGLKPLSGVTSLCHVGGFDAIVRWAVRKGLDRVRDRFVEHRRPDGFYEVFHEDFDDILKDAYNADREALDDASNVGHVSHAHIEDFIRAHMADDELRATELLVKMPEDDRAANCFSAFIFWIAAHNVRFLSTERRVVSVKHGYAGTADAEALVDSCDDPSCCQTYFRDQFSLVDHKTSNALREGYAMQTAAYATASEEEAAANGEPIEYQARWILRYGKEDAEFDPWYFPGRESIMHDSEAFRHSLEMHRLVDGIQQRVHGMNEERRALRKAKAAAEKEAAHRIECPKAKTYKGVKISKCFEDGAQCQKCASIYKERHAG